MNSPKYCLDTHSLIWYFTGQKTLSAQAKQIIDEVFSGKNQCFISSIVLLESFHVGLKNKKFNFPQFLKTLRLPNIIIVPLDKIVLLTCYQLPRNLDIHDRIISATAMINDCILVSKDRIISKLSKVKTVW